MFGASLRLTLHGARDAALSPADRSITDGVRLPVWTPGRPGTRSRGWVRRHSRAWSGLDGRLVHQAVESPASPGVSGSLRFAQAASVRTSAQILSAIMRCSNQIVCTRTIPWRPLNRVLCVPPLREIGSTEAPELRRQQCSEREDMIAISFFDVLAGYVMLAGRHLCTWHRVLLSAREGPRRGTERPGGYASPASRCVRLSIPGA